MEGPPNHSSLPDGRGPRDYFRTIRHRHRTRRVLGDRDDCPPSMKPSPVGELTQSDPYMVDRLHGLLDKRGTRDFDRRHPRRLRPVGRAENLVHHVESTDHFFLPFLAVARPALSAPLKAKLARFLAKGPSSPERAACFFEAGIGSPCGTPN